MFDINMNVFMDLISNIMVAFGLRVIKKYVREVSHYVDFNGLSLFISSANIYYVSSMGQALCWH